MGAGLLINAWCNIDDAPGSLQPTRDRPDAKARPREACRARPGNTDRYNHAKCVRDGRCYFEVVFLS